MAFRGAVRFSTGTGVTAHRWRGLAAAGCVAVLTSLAVSSSPAFADLNPLAGTGTSESLTLHNLHTDETATIVFKRGGTYDADGLKALNKFLRDPLNNNVGNMDPHLFDLLYDVYKQSGSDKVIQVLDGYRSPATNEYLRQTSDGVAENSLHMKGQAIDFFIPGLALATLRNIGLREQAGGVGFYPDSGSPFVHLDTGSVRHWPLLSRQQLLAVFPDGKTIDIPTDGDPLPGYNAAMAAYKQKEAALTPVTQVASFTQDGQPKGGLVGKFVTALGGNGSSPATTGSTQPSAPSAPAAPARPAAVTVASAAPVPVPKPNLAPKSGTAVVAAVPPTPRTAATVVAAMIPAPRTVPTAVASAVSVRAAEFSTPDYWNAPAVPSALAVAMAGHDTRGAGNLPIAPTAVVATISVDRTLAASAMTSAVIRGDSSAGPAPAILAYAEAAAQPVLTKVSAAPSGKNAIPAAPAASKPTVAAPAAVTPPLVMTALDTASLRMWMGQDSTRQQSYAMFTMPDASGSSLMSAATTFTAARFVTAPQSTALRTDRFAAIPASP